MGEADQDGLREDGRGHRVGGWPMTLARVRDFQQAFKGAPSRRVPFALHAVKYLSRLLEAAAAEAGVPIEEIEAKYGGADPPNAPWLVHPQAPTWQARMAKYRGAAGGDAIPYAGGPVDTGTERHPEWEGYEERRHLDAKMPISPEMADDRALGAREGRRDQADGGAYDHNSEVARGIERSLGGEGEADDPPPAQEPEDGAGLFD